MGARRGVSARSLKARSAGVMARRAAALESGEFVVSHSADGGGYGTPFERDPGRVPHDPREGWITAVRVR
jgi:N-methylhydantoinase B